MRVDADDRDPRPPRPPALVQAGGRERQILLGLWAFLFLVGIVPLAISMVVTPEDIEQGRVVLSPACTWKQLTGFACPTCGLTRAFCALGHGRFGEAMRLHVASPFAYVAFGGLAVFAAMKTWQTAVQPEAEAAGTGSRRGA